ncbi:MAG: HAMP domain-containing protein [Chloroflexi bacterium]|nr:HAMP domain-containing protein [Chloroflexota bacterium]
MVNAIWRTGWARYRRIGLQWRIMLYVTAGLAAFLMIYGIVALQTVQQASNLVFQERVAVARSLARAIDERLAQSERDAPEKLFLPSLTLDNARRAQTDLFIATQITPLVAIELEKYHIELLNEIGATVYSDSENQPLTVSPHWHLIEASARVNATGTNVHPTPRGEHVIAFAPMTRAPYYVVIEQSADEAFELPRRMQTQFILLAILTISGGLALAFLTTRRVVKPVNVLIHAANEIARGNLDHPLAEGGEGEVGALARTFAEMRARLKESQAEIARWNRELEARVEQRTRELRALVASSHALSSTLDLDPLFDILIHEARGVLPAVQGIALFLYENESQLLIVRSSYGLDADAARQLRFRVGEAIAGKVFQTATPMLLKTAAHVRAIQNDFSAESRAYFSNAVEQRDVQSALGAPLISKGIRVGALMTYSFSFENAFAESDVPVLQAFADQAAAAIENARLYAELARKEEMRAHLLEKVIQAQEAERKRIARELHDEVGQTLTALTIGLQSAERHLPEEFAHLKTQLKETEMLTTQTLKELSQLILELRPSVLDDLGLVPAIRRYAENRLESLGTRVSVEAIGLKKRLPAIIETTLFRIVQETVSNAAKYARAAHVNIRLNQKNGTLHVQVEDDGIGFDAEDAFKLKDNWRGLGLLGMRERAALVGGTVTIDSRLGKGTRVMVEVPWKEK